MKNLFLILLAILAFTSCEKQELTEQTKGIELTKELQYQADYVYRLHNPTEAKEAPPCNPQWLEWGCVMKNTSYNYNNNIYEYSQNHTLVVWSNSSGQTIGREYYICDILEDDDCADGEMTYITFNLDYNEAQTQCQNFGQMGCSDEIGPQH